MLDGGGQVDNIDRSHEDTDGAVVLELDEPLARRSENCGVKEPSADKDVRPGAGLGGRGLG
ncbi:hypothetical protein ACF08M_38045 [Streptomyces sp. NPDC015032]|uniref:hypothetical protein n=1 Tax=Streptomyces sp. NPDC015032 TaxID=3364937 RepID=UPI0036FC14B6